MNKYKITKPDYILKLMKLLKNFQPTVILKII